MNGRSVLVERVKYPAIQPQLQALPAPPTAPGPADSPGQGALLRVSPHRLLPPAGMAAHSTNSLLLASSSSLGKGLVLVEGVRKGSVLLTQRNRGIRLSPWLGSCAFNILGRFIMS